MRIDYLVIGAGAAGCALARRLAQQPDREILLIDAGASRPPAASWVPRALPFVLRSRALTSYEAATGGDPAYWVRGRGVGGSTLVNGMMWVRGEPAAYDELEAAGNPGWGWRAFRAAFGEIEARYVRPGRSSLNPVDSLALSAVAATGVPLVEDVNAGGGVRAGATPASIHRGLRRSASTAFLRGAGPNLRVLPNTSAVSLLWRGNRVVGARVRRGGSEREIHARRVAVCAGTIETPLLLERSGIGRPDVLRAAGIAVRTASPNVGERVLEQRGVGLQVRLAPGVSGGRELASNLAIGRQAARYCATLGGPIARPAYDATALISLGSESSPDPHHSRDRAQSITATESRGRGAPSGRPGPQNPPESPAPREFRDHQGPERSGATQRAFGSRDATVDAQVLIAPFAMADSELLRPAPYPGLLLAGYPLRPSTAASVHATSADPDLPPSIDASSPMTARDREAQDATLRALQAIASAGDLGALVIGQDHAGPGGPGSSIYHAVGSAAMGPSGDDPVDADLRVRGTEGLYVADLSILPFHPSGGTAAVASAIGWLAGARIPES